MSQFGMRPSLVALFDQAIQFEVNDIIHKDLTFLGGSMYNAHAIRTGIDLNSSGKVQAGAMEIHVLSLAEARLEFDPAAKKADGTIKVVAQLGDVWAPSMLISIQALRTIFRVGGQTLCANR